MFYPREVGYLLNESWIIILVFQMFIIFNKTEKNNNNSPLKVK